MQNQQHVKQHAHHKEGVHGSEGGLGGCHGLAVMTKGRGGGSLWI